MKPEYKLNISKDKKKRLKWEMTGLVIIVMLLSVCLYLWTTTLKAQGIECRNNPIQYIEKKYDVVCRCSLKSISNPGDFNITIPKP